MVGKKGRVWKKKKIDGPDFEGRKSTTKLTLVRPFQPTHFALGENKTAKFHQNMQGWEEIQVPGQLTQLAAPFPAVFNRSAPATEIDTSAYE
jgi:hypothetical protein